MNTTSADSEHWITDLQDKCGLIAQIGSSLDPETKDKRSKGKEWSPSQVLAHLLACQVVWGYSIYAMLAAENPDLHQFHPRDWASALTYDRAGFDHLLRLFIQERQELLRTLQRLQLDDWSKSAQIQGRTHTVYSQVRRMAQHELEHADQLGTFLE